jgi:hypothetical protein
MACSLQSSLPTNRTVMAKVYTCQAMSPSAPYVVGILLSPDAERVLKLVPDLEVRTIASSS